MPSSQTPNYQLSQWERSDKVQMEDFNADNAKIDAALVALTARVSQKAEQSALKAEADARAAAITSLSQSRNCQAVVITYTGTGTAGDNHPNTFTFDHKPMFIHVGGGAGDEYSGFSAARGQGAIYCHRGRQSEYIRITWYGNTVSWRENAYNSPEYQMNTTGKTYYLFAVLEL